MRVRHLEQIWSTVRQLGCSASGSWVLPSPWYTGDTVSTNYYSYNCYVFKKLLIYIMERFNIYSFTQLMVLFRHREKNCLKMLLVF